MTTLSKIPTESSALLGTISTFGFLYSQALTRHPLLTKAITGGVLAGIGNLIGQWLQNSESEETSCFINFKSLKAFVAYAALVQAPITHFWLNLLDSRGPKNGLLKLFVDRFLYGPVILLLTLYLLSIFQGSGHKKACQTIGQNYVTSLKANLKLWVICQYINLNFVPLPFRTLVTNLIALVWNIYLSTRQRAARKSSD